MSNIMIVDDSPTVLMSMENLLKRFGYDVIKADSAESAVSTVNSGPKPDLIITDFNMPGKNGAELIQALRGDARFRFTPMLVLTTESQRDKRDQAKACGATGWLVKPADPKQLEGVLKQLLPNG